MYLLMEKIGENYQFVFYNFYITVAGEEYINQYVGKELKKNSFTHIVHLIKSQKILFLIKKKKKNQILFFTDEGREVIHAQVALIRTKREGAKYSPFIEIATG
jgi:hypothetical protein